MTNIFIAYLDEFGHIGPYTSRSDPRYNASPVFGLGGIILPLHKVKQFSSWFYQRKNDLLDYEISQFPGPPYEFEKKGAALYTPRNISTYPELTIFTKRFLKAIEKFGGNIIYVGRQKVWAITDHDSDRLYEGVLIETVKRLNQHANQQGAKFLMVMDQHQNRRKLIRAAAIQMYGSLHGRHLLEQPFEVESQLYNNIQAADWICGLIGRVAARQVDPAAWKDMSWARQKFGSQITQLKVRSSIRQTT